jgi:hypothetical protein
MADERDPEEAIVDIREDMKRATSQAATNVNSSSRRRSTCSQARPLTSLKAGSENA